MKERRIGKEIKKVQVLMARYITKYMKNRENEVFSRIQIDIMEFLSKSEEDVYQKDLEQEFDLRKPTISGILKTMEKNEVIERVEAKQDSRSKQIILTEKGKKICTEYMQRINKMENLIKKNISTEELKIFFKVIDQIRNNLKE